MFLLNDAVMQVLQYTYTYDIKNAFFVDKDAYDNTKHGRRYKYNYHPNGQLKSKEEYYMDGPKVVKHGLHREWYKDGILEEESIFKDGKLQGLCRNWYFNGKLYKEAYYNDGKRYGLHRRWYLNDQLGEEYNRKDDKLHGIYRRWYENGELAEEREYANGELIRGKDCGTV